jgi:site-specific recombinase XerD
MTTMTRKRIKNISEGKSQYSSFEAAVREFLKFKKAQGMSELTMKDYHRTFDSYMKVSSDTLEVNGLKEELLSFLTPLADASPAKFNRPFSNLNTLFNWLVLQEVYNKNPLQSIGLKKKRDDGRIRCVETDSIKAVIDLIDLKTYTGLRDYSIILLILDCGIRPCEAFKVETNDIDFKNETLIIRKETSKTRTERVLPLSATMLDLLRRILQVKPTEWNNNLVFCSCDGLQMHTIMFDKRLAYYSHKANVKIRPYDLRHSFAIMYLRNNGNAFTLQKTMGHADLSMTKRYIGLSQNDLKEQHYKASPLQNIVKRNTRISKLFR